jgi:hypothetical protein
LAASKDLFKARLQNREHNAANFNKEGQSEIIVSLSTRGAEVFGR